MWLATASDTAWSNLTGALARGLPVPEGFVAWPTTSEDDIRAAYEELQLRTRTHFVAVRGPSHAVLNLIGSDALIHALRRLWAEAGNTGVLVQRMIPAIWCGTARRDGNVLQIKANQGMMIFDPDTYSFDLEAEKCIQRNIEASQRKMIRYVDGTSRTIQCDGDRPSMNDEQLKTVAALAIRAGGIIKWALDDQERPWLLSVNTA
jgi:hypothetical protein